MIESTSIWRTDYLTLKEGSVYAVLALASFHLASTFPACGFLMVVFLFCWLQLARVRSARIAIYSALVLGAFMYGPQLAFFWTIFKFSAVSLWMILAAWLAAFLVLQRACWLRFGPAKSALLAPFLWLGLEYFRSELYPLRFSWFTTGFAFSGTPQLAFLSWTGYYGIGFLFMAIAACVAVLPRKRALIVGTISVCALGLLTNIGHTPEPLTNTSADGVAIAGIQCEFPNEAEAIEALTKLNQHHPEAELLVMSEYTFDGPVPASVKKWCRKHHRYLVVGGKDPQPNGDFYNTAFVIGPDGNIVFQQVKTVPLQFFNDGMPAPEQKVWNSPWGKLGICICYDLSYTHVVDTLVSKGAQAIIVPTMDVADWGLSQHQLHSRIAPLRAAEAGLPIFRLASSGISQVVDHFGNTTAKTSFPGPDEILFGKLRLQTPGHLPVDRWLARASVALVASLSAWFCISAIKAKIQSRILKQTMCKSRHRLRTMAFQGDVDRFERCESRSALTIPSPPSWRRGLGRGGQYLSALCSKLADARDKSFSGPSFLTSTIFVFRRATFCAAPLPCSLSPRFAGGEREMPEHATDQPTNYEPSYALKISFSPNGSRNSCWSECLFCSSFHINRSFFVKTGVSPTYT